MSGRLAAIVGLALMGLACGEDTVEKKGVPTPGPGDGPADGDDKDRIPDVVKPPIVTVGVIPTDGWEDGQYTFAVLVPDLRDSGWAEGAVGNLSDRVAGGTPGDLGVGDELACRTFTIREGRFDLDGYVLNPCAHAVTGDTATARTIELTPFDEDATAGAYSLAICPLNATSASDCVFDDFTIERDARPAVVSGLVWYDANANGVYDEGEPGLAGWPVRWSGASVGEALADESGRFEVVLGPGGHLLGASLAAHPWESVATVGDELVTTGRSGAERLEEGTWSLALDGGVVDGLRFGAVCIGGGGSPGVGFWSNSNGKAIFGADDLEILGTLPLRNADGSRFDPISYDAFRTWYLSANASNTAFKLSGHLAAAALSLHNEFIAPDALVFAPGTNSASGQGFAPFGDLVTEATEALELTGACLDDVACEEHLVALKDGLTGVNTNRQFLVPDPSACPSPAFVP